MSFLDTPSENAGKPKETPKAGWHIGRICQIAFLGTFLDEFEGNPKLKRPLVVVFELDAKMSDGRPFVVSTEFNVTPSQYGGYFASKRSNACKVLKEWLGLDEQKSGKLGYFTQAAKDGVAADLKVAINDNGYAKIASIDRPRDEQPNRPTENPLVVWQVGAPKPEGLFEWIFKKASNSFEAKGEAIPVMAKEDNAQQEAPKAETKAGSKAGTKAGTKAETKVSGPRDEAPSNGSVTFTDDDIPF